MLQLILAKYLKMTFHSTSFSNNTYIIPGDSAVRLSRYELKDLQAGGGHRFFVTFLQSTSSTKVKKTKKTKDLGNGSSKDVAGKKRKRGDEGEEQSDKSKKAHSTGNFVDDEADSKLLAAVLTGVNRALPYAVMDRAAYVAFICVGERL